MDIQSNRNYKSLEMAKRVAKIETQKLNDSVKRVLDKINSRTQARRVTKTNSFELILNKILPNKILAIKKLYNLYEQCKPLVYDSIYSDDEINKIVSKIRHETFECFKILDDSYKSNINKFQNDLYKLFK